jgi:serine/threonine protein kinase
MANKRYQALGPLLAGEGSRAFIGLEISKDGRADPVVLVWVPEGTEKDPALLERIRKETEHAAKLDHPNIVRVHGFASLDEGFARVVEFADGESLRKLLEAAKKLPPPFAAKIVCDAAMGVHYAHMAGNDDGTPLVHGDIRPETLLLSFNGAVKVTGYGALAFAPREIGGQRVKGRRVHTAPEQIIGGREAYSIQTDVYLLGLTLHECLTGLVPFADQNDFFDHAVLTLPLQPPPPGEVPEALEKILYRACSKKVPERYANPLQLREEIEKAMGGTLPTNEELATFLKTYFPDSDNTRAARRQAIDAGVADYARKVWADRKMDPVFTPSGGTPLLPPIKTPMATPAVIAAVPKPPPPAAKPAPRPVSPTEVSSPSLSAVPERSNARTMAILGAVGAVVIGAIWFAVSASNAPIRPARTEVERVVDAGVVAAATPPVIAAVDAGAEAVDAGGPTAIAVAVIDAGPAVPELALVTVDVDPNVELSLEGKVLGRTPWTGRLSPGRKVFQLVNKELGIKTFRAILVEAGEKTSEKFKLNQGFVTLSAPEGAQVFINDRRIGSAPIRGEIPVYEGSHRIVVTVGKARWNEAFNLAGGQRINFNVEMQ